MRIDLTTTVFEDGSGVEYRAVTSLPVATVIFDFGDGNTETVHAPIGTATEFSTSHSYQNSGDYDAKAYAVSDTQKVTIP